MRRLLEEIETKKPKKKIESNSTRFEIQSERGVLFLALSESGCPKLLSFREWVSNVVTKRARNELFDPFNGWLSQVKFPS